MTRKIKYTPVKRFRWFILIFLCVLSGEYARSESELKPSLGLDNAMEESGGALRDPFWPVGYTPAWVIEQESPQRAINTAIDWNQAMKHISIQGVSSRSGHDFLAVINGRVKGVGETVSVRTAGLRYTWMIESIAPPNSVKLRRVSAQ